MVAVGCCIAPRIAWKSQGEVARGSRKGKSGKFQSCVGLFKAGLGDMTCHFMDSNM